MWTEAQVRQHLARLAGETTPAAAATKTAHTLPRPRMNKWEAAYDAELRTLLFAKQIDWYGFEAITLRLATGARYTPDFAVFEAGELVFIEVKGFWRDDALVKFKVAAELFPFEFRALRKKRVKEGGGWELLRVIGVRSASR